MEVETSITLAISQSRAHQLTTIYKDRTRNLAELFTFKWQLGSAELHRDVGRRTSYWCWIGVRENERNERICMIFVFRLPTPSSSKISLQSLCQVWYV